MVRHTAAIANSRGLQTTGMAFSSAVKLRPGSAKSPGAAHQNVNPGPLKSDQDDRLGYGSGVVERCDSVDLIMPNKNWDSAQKDKPHKPAFQPPVKNLELGGGLEGRIPSWKALPSRAFAGQRPSSAHVQGYRGGHGFERPLKPASPQIAVRGIENQNQVLSNSPKRPGQPRQAEQGLNGIVGVRKFNASLPQERVEEVEKPAEVANNSVEASEDGTSQIEQLRYMLRRQEAEKRNIERHNNALVHQNAELKEQVAHLAFEDFANAPTVQKPRQRPWSASSAQGSISGRHALRIPNGAYPPNPRMQQQQQGFQRSTVRGGSRGSSAQSNGYNGRSPVRPGSSSMAARAYPPGFLVQTGFNNRGKPMYGFGSLENRAVYTPCEENPMESEDARDIAVPSGPDDREGLGFSAQPLVPPEKDNLFNRPDAQRHFPMSYKNANTRSRPQSANAAVRTASAQPVSGRIRPGSARPRSSYAECLLHREADAFVGFHMVEKAEDAGRELSDILNTMRAKAASKHVRVIDFCLPFDKLRRGAMSSTEFRRALEAAGCFRDIEEEELRRVIHLFADDPGRSSSVYRPGMVTRVGYAAFCEVLQPVGDKRVRLSDAQRELLLMGKQRLANSLDNPLGANELSKAGETKVESIIARILERSQAHRVSIRDLLGPLASAAKSSSVTPNVTSSPGCISRSHFLRGIQTCHLGVRFTDEELALLFCKYERNAEFNYYRFCRDLEMAQQGLHLGAR